MLQLRVVAAIHRDLRALVIDAMLREKWKRKDMPTPRFTDHAMSVLESHDWPGNVRELSHVVDRVCALARGPELGIDLLPAEFLGPTPDRASVAPVSRPSQPLASDEPLSAEGLERSRAQAVTRAEREFLAALMRQANGNVSHAARQAGMHRSYLQRLLAKHRDDP